MVFFFTIACQNGVVFKKNWWVTTSIVYISYIYFDKIATFWESERCATLGESEEGILSEGNIFGGWYFWRVMFLKGTTLGGITKIQDKGKVTLKKFFQKVKEVLDGFVFFYFKW